MKTLCVLQHTEAEYLGLMEDHLEGRAIRFHYVRPFAPGTLIPAAAGYDGLVALGAGPRGIVSGDLVPTLGPELRLATEFLEQGLPVIGIGFGACLLAVATGGGAEAAPLRFEVGTAHRAVPDALGGHLPERYPLAIYMRDRPVLPPNAKVLATDDAGDPALFQIGGNSLGFTGHPGIKTAMVEDLIMEFEEVPDGTADTLTRLRAAQGEIAAALSDIMVGIIKTVHLMEPSP